MTAVGPMLETLTHRLSECLSDFLAEPALDGRPGIATAAVACDLLASLGGDAPGSEGIALLVSRPPSISRSRFRNFLRTVLIASWLLDDPWFRNRKLAAPARKFLEELEALAPVVQAERFVSDPDRREELARLCLASLGFRPAGESDVQAEDRLTTVSSIKRKKILQDTRAAMEHARKVMEAMKEKARQEAAAKVSRE